MSSSPPFLSFLHLEYRMFSLKNYRIRVHVYLYKYFRAVVALVCLLVLSLLPRSSCCSLLLCVFTSYVVGFATILNLRNSPERAENWRWPIAANPRVSLCVGFFFFLFLGGGVHPSLARNLSSRFLIKRFKHVFFLPGSPVIIHFPSHVMNCPLVFFSFTFFYSSSFFDYHSSTLVRLASVLVVLFLIS